MRAQFLAVVLLGACAGIAVGCGEGDSGGAGNKDQFISSLCAEYYDCCRAAGRPADGAQCRAFYGAFVGASTYDQAAAQACLSEVRARTDSCDTSNSTAPSCGKVFGDGSGGGTKQPGESCDDDGDCAPPETGEAQCRSDFVNGGTIRQCQVQLTGAVGSAPCVGTRDGNVTIYSGGVDGIPPTGYICDRADGLSCDSQSGACKSLGAAGEACTGSSTQCVTSAYCAFSEGMCKERQAVGSTCALDDECVASAYCDPAGKTCAARRATGEACVNDSECQSDDCTNEKCAVANDLSLTFVCGTN